MEALYPSPQLASELIVIPRMALRGTRRGEARSPTTGYAYGVNTKLRKCSRLGIPRDPYEQCDVLDYLLGSGRGWCCLAQSAMSSESVSVYWSEDGSILLFVARNGDGSIRDWPGAKRTWVRDWGRMESFARLLASATLMSKRHRALSPPPPALCCAPLPPLLTAPM